MLLGANLLIFVHVEVATIFIDTAFEGMRGGNF